MNYIGLKILCLILVFVAVLPSCSVTKLIPEGQYLVTKNKVHIVYPDSIRKILKVKQSQALDYIPLSQTPNSRVLGADFRTWLYLKSDSTNTNWGNRTLRKMGQIPIYFDSTQTTNSVNNMRMFMASKGYLDNTISTNVRYKDKRVYVDYNIDSKSVYLIDSVKYNISDNNIAKYILTDTAGMLLKKNKVFTRDILDNERKRIVERLNNIGFYSFSINDVDYLIDTTHVNHTAFVQVNVNKINRDGEAIDHKKFKIRNIYVYPNFNGEEYSTIDTVDINKVKYIYTDGNINVKPKPLSQKIMFGIDSLWSPDEIKKTNRSFYNMRYYRTSSIDFKQIITPDSTKFNYLDTYIRLIPSKIHSIKLEGEVSSNSAYTSIIARLGYTNKNIFKHSEVLEINFDVGYDLFYNRSKNDAYQVGVESILSFPKLIVPFRVKSQKYIDDIESYVSVGYNIQNRPDYSRNITTTSFGYKWSDGKNIRFNYNPIALSFVSLPRVDSVYLANIENDYLRATYTDQLIAATTLGVIYDITKPIGSNYNLKVNFETAGNILYLGSLAVNQKKVKNDKSDDMYYEILNVGYAQYARLDLDFSYKYNFGPKSALVTRFYGGYGFGYGNSKTMPFERQFYSGGNASMRGWAIRSIGPGAKQPDKADIYPNSTGGIRLEMNVEGRFPIFGPIRGAVFFDLGNVWSDGRGEPDKSGVFYIDKFYKQLGFNTGIGLRLDLSFFVLRLDWGIILHNPSKISTNGWINEFNLSDTTLHFAIGYPF